MVFLLVFTALVTPFEVAFLLGGKIDTLFVINRCVDLGFLIDMGVQCFVKYFDADTATWVTNLSFIRWRYLKTW